MRKIIFVLLMAVPMLAGAQVLKKVQIQRLKVDTLITYGLRQSMSDTCVILKNDTLYWMPCSSIAVDTSVFSAYSDTSRYSDTAGYVDGLFDTTVCHTLIMDSINSCGDSIVINGVAYFPDTVHFLNYTFPLLDGNSGDVLTTDGSGAVSWQPASGGASYWDSTNTVIHTNDSLADVAIGTSKTAGTEKFRVNNGAVLFDGTTGSTPVSGAGTRLMWIPAKAAFRAGQATSNLWDDAQIGSNSFSVGLDNWVTGQYAGAGGYLNQATGVYNFAWGNQANATGASGAVAMGQVLTASGQYSACFNALNTSSGEASFAANWATIAAAYASTAHGRYNTGGGTAGSWVSTDPLFQIGNGTGTGANSNDAFKVLKNGTTYIGDASSTQDPVMTVNTTDSTVDVRGWLMVDRKDHGFYAFEDSAVVIDCSTNTWVQVTNGTKTLFTAVQTDAGFTIQNDTITFEPHDTISGTSPHIIIHWGVDGHGANGEDFEVRMYNVTSATGIVRKAESSTMGANNRIEIGTTSYDKAANVGDKYVLQIKNVGSNNDFTIENGSIYLEVSHY